MWWLWHQTSSTVSLCLSVANIPCSQRFRMACSSEQTLFHKVSSGRNSKVNRKVIWSPTTMIHHDPWFIMIENHMIHYTPYVSISFLILIHHPIVSRIMSAQRIFWLSRKPQLGLQLRPSWNIKMAPSECCTQMWQRDSSLKGPRDPGGRRGCGNSFKAM